jgi:hypothetical protein
MGNRRKTRAAFKIKQNTKYENTTPELALDEICGKLGLVLISGKEIQVPGFTLKVDRQVQDTDVVFEALGPHHFTDIQRQKTSWRTDLLVQSGLRVLLIESELLVCHGLQDSRRFHPYVAIAISEFLLSDEKVKYLRA